MNYRINFYPVIKGKIEKAFTWADYKWNPSGDGKTFTKYTKPGDKLELEDDAAHVNMGGDWHMPTPEQYNELFDNTKIEPVGEGKNTKGLSYTSKSDPSKSIFIPFAGYAVNGSIHHIRKKAYLWFSFLSDSGVDEGTKLNFGAVNVSNIKGYRYYGFPVRGVIG